MTFQPGFRGRAGSFPQLLGSATGNNGPSRTTSSTITFDAAAVAGQRILIGVVCEKNAAAPSTPAGYSVLSQTIATVNISLSIYYKVATGGETSVVLSHGSNFVAWITDRFAPAGTPQTGSVLQAATLNPDPPALSPSGGANKYEWVAYMATASASVSAYPASYVSGVSKADASGANVVARALRPLAAATENPGTFTTATSATSLAQTLAIPPT